jgi:hypothetical protein
MLAGALIGCRKLLRQDGFRRVSGHKASLISLVVLTPAASVGSAAVVRRVGLVQRQRTLREWMSPRSGVL